MNVGGIAGNEYMSDAHSRGLAMMDPKIAAPMEGARLNSEWSSLRQRFSHKVKRGSVSFCLLDCGHDAPTG